MAPFYAPIILLCRFFDRDQTCAWRSVNFKWLSKVGFAIMAMHATLNPMLPQLIDLVGLKYKIFHQEIVLISPQWPNLFGEYGASWRRILLFFILGNHGLHMVASAS